MPGLVDLAARLREPGHEHEGMLESELAAAAAGGVTSLVCPPDTDPPLDEPGLVEMLKFRARKLSRCRLFPLGALTRGLAGEALTEMAELTEAGCVGFSQADVPVRDTQVLQRALQYAATFGYTVWLRPQDAWLGDRRGRQRRGGHAARACRACRWPPRRSRCTPSSSWCAPPARACTCAGCRAPPASSWCARAKAEGLPVTADVSINSLHLTDVDIGYFNAAMRLDAAAAPAARPRRAARRAGRRHDRRAGVRPHAGRRATRRTCRSPRPSPAPPASSCCSGLALKWGERRRSWRCAQTLARVTSEPVRVLGRGARLAGVERRPAGRRRRGRRLRVRPGARAGRCAPQALRSQGKHTPFAFETTARAAGRVRATLVAGDVAYEAHPA